MKLDVLLERLLGRWNRFHRDYRIPWWVRRNQSAKALTEDRRPVVYLSPHPSAGLPVAHSKMGGTPHSGLLGEWPKCPDDGTPMHFVLQFFRDDFPEFPWPESVNLLQLFRCSRTDCPGGWEGGDWEASLDRRYLWFMGCASSREGLPLERPDLDPELEARLSAPITECTFEPVRWEEIPHPHSAQRRESVAAFEHLDEDPRGDHVNHHLARRWGPEQWTKIGGHPAFFGSEPDWPMCDCAQPKSFCLQVSSNESDYGAADYRERSNRGPACPHGLEMGDGGLLFLFLCPSCGPSTMQALFEMG